MRGGKKMSEEEARSSKLPLTSIHGQKKTLNKVIGREGTSTEAHESGESGDPVNVVGANIY